MSELNYRVLYLPSLGFCLLVVIGAKRISQHIGNKVTIAYILMILFSVCFIHRELYK